MKRITIILGVVVAACFGSGPAPTPPSGAQVVFVAPLSQSSNPCNGSFYVSSVAFSPTNGYGILNLYQPFNNNCGGPPPPTGISVYQFDPGGSMPQGVQQGSAGQSNSNAVPLAANGLGDAYWMVSNFVSKSTGGITANVSFGTMTPAGFVPLGLFAGAAHLWMYGQNQIGGYTEEPWNPQWPCCGINNTNNQPGGLYTIDLPFTGGSPTATQIGSQSQPFCDELKQCLVGNSMELYYMRHGDAAASQLAVIDRVTKPIGPVTTLDTIDTGLSSNAVPVGLAATETHVAWAVAISGQASNQLQPGCWIFVRDLSQPMGKLVLQSSKFSCLDVGIDDTSVYFTIVETSHSNDCGGCQEPIRGDGVARVSFDGTTYESLAFKMSGAAAGPRRVYVFPNSIFVVDPFAVAKIDKTELDGKQDIPYQ